MHSAEGAMFPRHEPALSVGKISDFWSRKIDPPASSDELLSILVGAWWLGELRGNARHSRLQLLRMMFTSQYKDDLGIVFVVGDGEGSREDESRYEIVVPSSNTGNWDEAACNEAFERMAQITERSLFEKRRLFESYQEFAI